MKYQQMPATTIVDGAHRKPGTLAVPYRLVALLLATALVAGLGVGLVQNGTSHSAPGTGATLQGPSLTPAQQAEWKALTATPSQRAIVVEQLQQAFAGVATVSAPGMPTASPAAAPGQARLVMSYGISGDHFWVIASYSDMARGAIWTAAAACSTRLPAWICGLAAKALSSWAAGWGSGNSHGVWASVYWQGPRWSGGRW